MAHTLASIRDQVEINLADSSNLIWSTTILDEAIRAALLDISRIYDDVLTLNGLDGAGATTVEDLDAYVLVKGAAAHALVFRVVGRFEEATPEPNITPSLADLAEQRMKEFKSYLVQMDYLINGYVQDEAFYNWKTAENVLDRAHELAVLDDQQAWNTAENALDRAAKTDLQDDQFDWKTAEAVLDRAHAVAEAALDRAARSDLQDDQFDWKTAEAVLDRAHAVSESALDRAAKADLQDDQQTWSTAEKALDRAARAALDQAERDYKDAQLAAEEARLTELQESTDTPWSGWEWEEGSGFS
jgi:predicted protein tyrosine phosphatase